jgi:hypothetical protein
LKSQLVQALERNGDGASGRQDHARDAGKKLARPQLIGLEFAEQLGNVSEACRRGGIDRTSFYN